MINAPTQQALLAIMVHAAMADGEKSQAERDFVRDLSLQLDEQGGAKQLAQAVQAALLGRLSAQQAAGQLQDPMHRQLAYEWATAVCHADGLCRPAESAFLQQLKTHLQLGGAEPEAHMQVLGPDAVEEMRRRVFAGRESRGAETAVQRTMADHLWKVTAKGTDGFGNYVTLADIAGGTGPRHSVSDLLAQSTPDAAWASLRRIYGF